MEARILVVDDEAEIRVSCRKIFERAGWRVVTASDGAEAMECLKGSAFDLLFLDLRMPRLGGMDIICPALSLDPSLTIVMFTAFSTVETAVEAVKRGAFDYLAKPFTAEQILAVAGRALQNRRRGEVELQMLVASNQGFDRILGTSDAMQKLYQVLQKIMRSEANILLQGETGTGKELVARTIHAHSHRAEGPFIAVDCATIPENLLESELFGHERGAFTGADCLRKGLVEQAHGGTLFLDEIGELPLLLQAKLLRTLQEREFRRLGGDRTHHVDIRVIAATNRDLRERIAERSFREDLYYRLNVVNVHLPPLRDRGQDIVLLARHFLDRFGGRSGRESKLFSADAIRLLLSHRWPGNVRELQNAVHHAVLLAESSEVKAADFPEALRGEPGSAGPSFHSLRAHQIEAVEKTFLAALLEKHQGNVTCAAAEAGMTRKMVYRLAAKFGLEMARFRV